MLAELLGTFVLVLCGVGSAVFGIDTLGPVGVALAFGLVLLALAYAIGPISGAHVNPAVTLGVLLSRGVSARDAALYVLAQLLGATAAAGLITTLVRAGGVRDQTGGLGTNTWGEHITGPGAFAIEVVLTALLVLVVLMVTSRDAAPGFAGLAIGLTLTVVHLVALGLDATSVNPARSLGLALFQGGTALDQLWLFILAPLLGALIGFGLQALLRDRSSVPDSTDGTGAAGGTGDTPGASETDTGTERRTRPGDTAGNNPVGEGDGADPTSALPPIPNR